MQLIDNILQVPMYVNLDSHGAVAESGSCRLSSISSNLVTDRFDVVIPQVCLACLLSVCLDAKKACSHNLRSPSADSPLWGVLSIKPGLL